MDEAQTVNQGAAEGATQNQTENQGEQEKTYTHKEFEERLQSETDKRVNQALDKFRQKELPGLLSGAKKEAEELAKMNAEQKEKYQREKLEKSLSDRELEVSRRELKIEAHKIFMEKGLPAELLEVLDYSAADRCSASIDAAEKAFRQAVEKGVNDRLRESAPPKAPTSLKASKTLPELMQEANAHPERLTEIMAQISAQNKI